MNILFLCTANSCRSILSEALFNHLAPTALRAVSAGSQPSGVVHPLTLKALQRAGIATTGLASKSSDSHTELKPEIIITVCDKAAGEACPVYFGSAVKAHWGLKDPSEVAGTEAQIDSAFDATLAQIRTRIEAFLALPLDRLGTAELATELARIGRL